MITHGIVFVFFLHIWEHSVRGRFSDSHRGGEAGEETDERFEVFVFYAVKDLSLADFFEAVVCFIFVSVLILSEVSASA